MKNFERSVGISLAAAAALGTMACGSEAPPPADAPVGIVNPRFIPPNPIKPMHEPGLDGAPKSGRAEGYTNLSKQVSRIVAPAVSDMLKCQGRFEDSPSNSPSYIDFVKQVKTNDKKDVRVTGSIVPTNYTYTFGLSTLLGKDKTPTTIQVTEQGSPSDPVFQDGNQPLNPAAFAAGIQKEANTDATTGIIVNSKHVNLELRRNEASKDSPWFLLDPRTGRPPTGLKESSMAAASRVYEKAHDMYLALGCKQ